MQVDDTSHASPNTSSADRESLSGTERAFVEELFNQHRIALHRYLAGLVGTPADAAELLQETFVRIIRQSSLAHLKENTRAYLFRVATNLARDHLRGRRRHSTDTTVCWEDVELTDPIASPSLAVEEEQALAALAGGLAELDTTCRNVFLAHRFRDMSYAEIAQGLGISVRRVERHLTRAVAHLKSKLQALE